jgi:hypothetical protein
MAPTGGLYRPRASELSFNICKVFFPSFFADFGLVNWMLTVCQTVRVLLGGSGKEGLHSLSSIEHHIRGTAVPHIMTTTECYLHEAKISFEF